ncbi:MAG: sulfite exporter TauE/SafE family protein [Nitrososphaerota archaeon]|nr:sulfite exporter TauE/SafE family protein [Nitrososphaerota archaeon]
MSWRASNERAGRTDFVLIVAVASAFLISIVFSMFGQGGGSVYTPTLFLLGYAALVSVSTSLMLNLVTALFSTLVYYRQRLVDLRLASAFVPGIVVGSFLGGALGNFADTGLLMWLFVAFLVGAGARMVYTYWEKAPSEAAPSRTSLLMYGVIGIFSFGVGVLSGLLGVGGGILIVPFLIFVYGVPTKLSAGTTGFVVIFSSLFGVLGHSAFGHLDYGLALPAVVAVAAGGVLGARFMVKTSAKWVKTGFGLLMFAFAIQLVVKLIG